MNNDLELKLLTALALYDFRDGAARIAPLAELSQVVNIKHVLSVSPTEISVITHDGDAYRITVRKVDDNDA